MYKEGSPETHYLMHHGRMLSWVWVGRRDIGAQPDSWGLRRYPTITGGTPDRGRTSWLVPHHLRGDGFFLDAGDNPLLDASPSANGQTTGTHSTLVCRTGYADRQILRSPNPRGSRPGNRPAVGVSLLRGLGKENDGIFSNPGTLSGGLLLLYDPSTPTLGRPPFESRQKRGPSASGGSRCHEQRTQTDDAKTNSIVDEKWLGDQESNLGSQIQNLLSCP